MLSMHNNRTNKPIAIVQISILYNIICTPSSFLPISSLTCRGQLTAQPHLPDKLDRTI